MSATAGGTSGTLLFITSHDSDDDLRDDSRNDFTTATVPRTVRVHDMRSLPLPPSLDREGFAVLLHTPVATLDMTPEDIRAKALDSVAKAISTAIGANRVFVFDFTVRGTGAGETGMPLERDDSGEIVKRKADRRAHCDYTVESGPRRAAEVLADHAVDVSLPTHFAIYNAWHPLIGPLRDNPLALCDTRSITMDDLRPVDIQQAGGREGQVYEVQQRDTQRWHYVSDMRPEEMLLFVGYDSSAPTRFVPHGAFDDLHARAPVPPRASIEFRVLALFD
ncbi:CmcJ/NvfI family oxidoreductase [Pandoraea sp. PE-S2R-1]|uniref:CmcJ/NvfI family oxidoreductase n=1 Tax=Pandoraea sp. PE-S2R-1 TaxID=1986994 RepID=UPI001130DB3E|nr:CmcJ/NvfI family oxidoreductase [Pandoraea sp. PE-S2R-1]